MRQRCAYSAVLDSYSENKILYRKVINVGQEYFEFSNNPNDELYRVTFSLIGPNKGNYVIKDNNAVQVIYEYSPPVNGIPTGAYEPLVKLIPPEASNDTVLNAKFSPNEKTEITAEEESQQVKMILIYFQILIMKIMMDRQQLL